MAALATASTSGNRSAAARAALDVRLGRGPLAAEGEDLGGAGVRPGQVERAVDVLCQRRRQLRVGDGRVPVAPAEMSVAQMRQARTRIGRGRPVRNRAAATPRSAMAPARSST